MPDDTSNRKPPDDKLLATLLVAIGKSDAGEAERGWFKNWFRALKQEYQARLPAFDADTKKLRKLLRKLQASTAARHELRRQLAPLRYELARIRHIRLGTLQSLDEESRIVLGALTSPDILTRAERAEEDTIGIFLETSDDYRKDPIRKLVTEPFLVMLRNEEVIGEDMSSPRGLPLTHTVEALFDFLGIGHSRRPTNLRVIVSDVRRTFERRPAQAPKG